MTYLAYASTPWLTLLILSPLVGLALAGLAGTLRLDDRTVKIGATAWSTIPLALAIIVWVGFDPNATADGQGVVQFVEKIPWVQAIRVDYFVGVDGISMPLVILTAVMAPVAILASFGITERVKLYIALMFCWKRRCWGTSWRSISFSSSSSGNSAWCRRISSFRDGGAAMLTRRPGAAPP